jgi:hypothetical protein
MCTSSQAAINYYTPVLADISKYRCSIIKYKSCVVSKMGYISTSKLLPLRLPCSTLV